MDDRRGRLEAVVEPMEIARRTGTQPQVEAPRVLTPPRALPAAWIVLGLLTLAEALHDVLGIGHPNHLFEDWLHDGVILAAAGLCLWRAGYEARGRGAWLAIGLGLLSWGLSERIVTLVVLAVATVQIILSRPRPDG